MLDIDLAGGAMLDVGIYPVTFARFLAGDPVEAKVMGTLGETGVDATVIRVVFVLATLFGFGSALLIYVALGLILD